MCCSSTAVRDVLGMIWMEPVIAAAFRGSVGIEYETAIADLVCPLVSYSLWEIDAAACDGCAFACEGYTGGTC